MAGPLEGMHVYVGERPSFLDPLNAPTWVPAGQAHHMRDGDFVLGYSHGDFHVALPWWVMKNHHVANLQFSGEDVVILLCENCSSAAAFDGRIDGHTFTFRVAGTYRGTFFVEDSQSGTYWAPFMGQAIHGRHAGARMVPLPLYQCSWAEWKNLHPDTVVQAGEGEPRDGHGAGTEPGSMLKSEHRMAKAVAKDARLKRNALVLGVQVARESRAYPLERLSEQGGVINDELGGAPILVACQPGSVLALAYSRTVEHQTLTFAPSPAGIQDSETGSVWGVEGKSSGGPLAGHRLEFVQSLVSEWYEYQASHTGVDIYGGGRAARA